MSDYYGVVAENLSLRATIYRIVKAYENTLMLTAEEGYDELCASISAAEGRLESPAPTDTREAHYALLVDEMPRALMLLVVARDRLRQLSDEDAPELVAQIEAFFDAHRSRRESLHKSDGGPHDAKEK